MTCCTVLACMSVGCTTTCTDCITKGLGCLTSCTTQQSAPMDHPMKRAFAIAAPLACFHPPLDGACSHARQLYMQGSWLLQDQKNSGSTCSPSEDSAAAASGADTCEPTTCNAPPLVLQRTEHALAWVVTISAHSQLAAACMKAPLRQRRCGDLVGIGVPGGQLPGARVLDRRECCVAACALQEHSTASYLGSYTAMAHQHAEHESRT